MVYEFWDIRSNNLIAAFESELEAIDLLRAFVREGGERSLQFLMVVEDDEDNDRSRVLGIGLQLAELMKSVA